MQNFLSLWLNAAAHITHGGQVQRPRQKKNAKKTPKKITMGLHPQIYWVHNLRYEDNGINFEYIRLGIMVTLYCQLNCILEWPFFIPNKRDQ